MDFAYSLMDRIFRVSIGEAGDFSGARFGGDFSLTLEEGQRRKHEFVWDSLGLEPGMRVLDMGCGWGPLMTYLNGRGARTVGVPLSARPAAACRRRGLDVHLMDCREVTPETFGPFDAVASLGAFEHFCSDEEYLAGRQEDIYRRVFATVHALLPPGGRFFLQTMVFGPNMIPYEQISVDAPHLSDGHVLGLMGKRFPGSWLPYGSEQIERTAAPLFTLRYRESGRLDYIETIRRWRERFARPSPRKILLKLTLAPRYVLSRDFRLAFASGISANTICFERLLLDHYRLVFERVNGPDGRPGLDGPAAPGASRPGGG
jgi:cyclopropane-fatty-acyl-phospholipid synthase